MPRGTVRGAHPRRLSLPCRNSRVLQEVAYTQGLLRPSDPRCPSRYSLKPGEAWAMMEPGELEGSRTGAWVWAGAHLCLSLNLYPRWHSLGYNPLHRAMVFRKKKKPKNIKDFSKKETSHTEILYPPHWLLWKDKQMKSRRVICTPAS